MAEVTHAYEFTDTIRFPLDVTWPVYRNEVPNLIHLLPNIERIDVQKREEFAGGVNTVLYWHAKAKLPGPAARLVSKDMFSWIDTATWTDKDHYVDYVLALPELSDAVRVSGRNTFVADGANTRIMLKGTIHTDLDKIKIVPKLLLKTIVPTIQAFAVQLTKPNFTELNRGVEKFLGEKKR